MTSPFKKIFYGFSGFAIAILCAASSPTSTVFPTEDGTRSRLMPEDDLLQRESTYKKMYNEEVLKRLSGYQRDYKNRTVDAAADAQPATSTQVTEQRTKPASIKGNRPRSTQRRDENRMSFPVGVLPQPLGPRIVTFNVTDDKDAMTVVPMGSSVKAKVLTGVEANTLEPYPILLSLEYAFLGPNKKRIDLSHCFMIAKAKANLSTERVLAETTELSCVRDDGEHVKRTAKAYLSGDDSTFGVQGQLISKQGQVLLAAVLSNLAKGAGEAVATAQKSTQIVTTAGGSAAATNVTGSQAAFIAGSATTDAAATIANWYLDYAKQLIPSIAIGSGKTVWITLLDTIEVPPLNSPSQVVNTSLPTEDSE